MNTYKVEDYGAIKGYRINKINFWQKFWLFLLGSNCSNCRKGRLSRDLIGFGKKAECWNCHKVFNVEWF
jgi:hypothetical protein